PTKTARWSSATAPGRRGRRPPNRRAAIRLLWPRSAKRGRGGRGSRSGRGRSPRARGGPPTPNRNRTSRPPRRRAAPPTPIPLPLRGYLERQTASGWRDEEHEAFPVPTGTNPTDLPREPDPLLTLLMAPDGSGGWALGGETGERVAPDPAPVQTAAVMRYGPG